MKKTICTITTLFIMIICEVYAQESKVAVLKHGTEWLFVYSRNAGESVPKGGKAMNFTNYKSTENERFKGDYYTYQEAKDNINKICPKSWRLPTEKELDIILKAMEFSTNSTAVYVDNKFVNNTESKSYFPLSGHSSSNNRQSAHYWSSDMDDEYNAYALYLEDTVSWIDGSAIDVGLSVRCVKTTDPYLKLIDEQKGRGFYVYDRNAGVNVPKEGKVDSQNKSFEGDQYNKDQIINGKNNDGTPICPEGWRLPVTSELNSISKEIKNQGSTIMINNVTCYFPTSTTQLYGHGHMIINIKTAEKIDDEAARSYVRCVTTF